jgi:ABC-2 type transport system ATP-binding protein
MNPDPPGGAPPPVIEVRGLVHRFGGLTAVDRFDLTVEPGQIFGLVGPDGAGKTTVMRILCGIIEPTGGRVRVAGFDLGSDAEEAKRRVGYLSQRFSLYQDLTVDENLRFFARIHGVPRRDFLERSAELLAAARLEPFGRRLAGNLSGGMKQKLALACTLIHAPELLVLDEPTTGVDPVSRRDFWRILYGLLGRGVTILVSTPYMDEAERCGRLALMDRGRVLVEGTPAELKGMMTGELVEAVAEPLAKARDVAARVVGVGSIRIVGDRLHLRVDRAAEAEAALLPAWEAAGVGVGSLRPIAPGLEDVFVSLLDRPGPAVAARPAGGVS